MGKIFWENPYQHTLKTNIAQVDGNKIVCEDTIAYSFAGGQESDKATINGMPIIGSQMEGNLIYYTVRHIMGFLSAMK